ncbi:MAG: hypothetical protein ACSHYF_10160 [Verrucomicrobiaceae bacterium]
MARILIVEEALRDQNGHWYEYNHAIVEEARARGHEVAVLAHRDIEVGLKDELGASAFFPVTSWDQVYNHPSAWRRYLGILQHNRSIAKLLTGYFQKQEEAYDVVLVPTVVLFHWMAWRRLVAKGAGKWFHKVVLTTRNNAGEYDPETKEYQFGASAKVLAKVLKSFGKPVRDGVVELASDSRKLAEQYEALCGLPFRTYPHPRPTGHLKIPEAREELIFSALGPPRFEKGSDLVLEAVQRVLEMDPEFPGRFVIQWTAQVYDLEGREVVIPDVLKNDARVEVLDRPLSSEEYERRIESSSVLMLPYRRAQYHARLSGIAIEAFQSGVPCICVSDTWVEDCMNEIGFGMALANESADELVEAIFQMAKNPPITVERIEAARRAYSPGAFVDLLMKR